MIKANSVARTLGAIFLVLGAACAPFMAAAAAVTSPSAPGLAASTTACLFLGGAMRLASRGRALRGGVREALVVVIAAWFVAPLLTCFAFIAEPTLPSLGRAYFDALSALTTTGFAPAFLVADKPPLILVMWWNTLQWMGGAFSIMVALIVLSSINLTGPGVHRSTLFTLDPDRLLDRFASIGRATWLLYAGATVVVIFLAWLGAAAPVAAVCVGLSSVATGALMLPDGEMAASGLSGVTLLAACLGLLFGALNFALHWDHVRARAIVGHLKSEETRAFVGLVALAAIMSYLATPSWDRSAGLSVVDGLSLASTAGWTAGGGLTWLPGPMMLMIILIGGAPISTAGGLKIIRLTLLSRHISDELRRLAHPSAVSDVRYRDRILPQRAVMGLLLYVIGYTGAAAGTAFLAATGGAPLDAALAIGAAAVTNAGPVADHAAFGAEGYIHQSFFATLATCVGMVLGRLEILAAFAIFLPSFWSK